MEDSVFKLKDTVTFNVTGSEINDIILKIRDLKLTVEDCFNFDTYYYFVLENTNNNKFILKSKEDDIKENFFIETLNLIYPKKLN